MMVWPLVSIEGYNIYLLRTGRDDSEHRWGIIYIY